MFPSVGHNSLGICKEPTEFNITWSFPNLKCLTTNVQILAKLSFPSAFTLVGVFFANSPVLPSPFPNLPLTAWTVAHYQWWALAFRRMFVRSCSFLGFTLSPPPTQDCCWLVTTGNDEQNIFRIGNLLICRWHPGGWMQIITAIGVYSGSFGLHKKALKSATFFSPLNSQAPQQTHLDRIGASCQLMVSPRPWHQVYVTQQVTTAWPECAWESSSPHDQSRCWNLAVSKKTHRSRWIKVLPKGTRLVKQVFGSFWFHLFGSIYLVPSIGSIYFWFHPLGSIYLASASSIT